MYRAVLDTCVLVPSLQRDLLLQLAAELTYTPLWGSGILIELDYVLAKLDERRGITESAHRRSHLFSEMERAFPEATVNAPKGANYNYSLADPDDEHVAHAAVIGRADGIITDDNRAGFSTSEVLHAARVEVLSPSSFTASIAASRPTETLRAIATLSRRRKISIENLLDELCRRYGMTDMRDTLAT